MRRQCGALGNFDFAQYGFDDVDRTDAVGFGLVGECDAVTQDVGGNFLDVVGQDESSHVHESDSACGIGERNRGSWASAAQNTSRNFGQAVFFWVSRRLHDIDDVILDAFIGIDALDIRRHGEDICRRDDAIGRRVLGLNHPSEHSLFFVDIGIIDDDFEHESVDLRLGQGVSSLLIDGVLRCHDEKWAR